MNFRILDLLILTTIFALLAIGFRQDLVFFRQFLWFALVTGVSAISVLLLPAHQHRQRIIGAFGGLIAGLIFLGCEWIVINQFFDQLTINMKMSVSAFQLWLIGAPPVAIASPLLGSASGPLFALRFRKSSVSLEFNKSILFSSLLIGLAIILSLFAMSDRITMWGQSRDWSVLVLILLVLFVVYTFGWLGQLEKRSS